LEKCLHGINEQAGIIERLLKQNQNTANVSRGAARLMNAPFDIAQRSYPEDKSVNTQAATRPLPGPALYHLVLGYHNGVTHKIVMPLQYLLKGWGSANQGHQCYVHTISKTTTTLE
jgi:hypothetical protein